MTQQQDPTTWQQHTDPAVAAKAAAAYAKASAKASRPWYKKKRFIVPAGFVVLIGLSVGMTGGGDDSSGPQVVAEADAAAGEGKAKQAKQADQAAELGTKGNPVGIGKTVELEGTRYTVESARKAPTVGGEFFEETASGVYVIVDLTIENTKDESKLFSDSAAQFVANDDTSYGTDSDATIAGTTDGEEPLFLTEMHPDLPTGGQLIFDVPPAKTKGGLLEVSDLFGGGEAYIKLNLK